MDAALVRMLLQSIIKGDLNQFDKSEQCEAIQWLEQRTYLTRRDKGTGPRYQPQIDHAARSLKEALACWERGDQAAAKRFAQESLMNLDS